MSVYRPVTDTFGRIISYLRLSVTDRCSMRCVYCAPEKPEFLPEDKILSIDELARIAKVAVDSGISKIRLTGGEPLSRDGIVELVERIAAFPGLEDLSLTTNGLALTEHAAALKKAGLHRVNVSLDTLRPDRFKAICRAGELATVINGIDSAVSAGLNPVKVNVVVRRNANDDELEDFVTFSLAHDITIRFIEFMPSKKDAAAAKSERVPAADMIAKIRGLLAPGAEFVSIPGEPARYLPLASGGSVGIISPVTHGFCDNCNRMRLTSDGRLRGCLFSDENIEIKQLLAGDPSDDAIYEAFVKAAAQKGRKGDFSNTRPQMHRIGG